MRSSLYVPDAEWREFMAVAKRHGHERPNEAVRAALRAFARPESQGAPEGSNMRLESLVDGLESRLGRLEELAGLQQQGGLHENQH